MILIKERSESKRHVELQEIKKLIERITSEIDIKEIDSALDMNIIAYERALALDEPFIISEILFNFGSIEYLNGRNQKAMSYFIKAHKMAQEIQNHTCMIQVLSSVANIFSLNSEYKSALDAYSQIIEIIDSHPEMSSQKNDIYNNMGYAFLQIGAYNDAEKSYNLALDADSYNPSQPPYPLFKAHIYNNLAELYLSKKEFDLAETNLKLGRECFKALDDQAGLAFCFHLEATLINERDHNWKKAEKLYDIALDLITQYAYTKDITQLLAKYGKQAFIANQYSKAQELLEKAYNMASEYQYLQMQVEIGDVLEQIYLREKKYENAHLMVKRQLEIKNIFTSEWERSNLKSFVKDVSEDEESRQLEELKRSIRIMKMLAEVGQSITACMDINPIFDIVSETIIKILNLSSFAISLIDENKTSMTIKTYEKGAYTEINESLDSENSFMVWCMRSQNEIIIYSPKDILTYQSLMNTTLVERLELGKIKSLLFCPMYNEDVIIGGVTVQSEKPFNFSYVDLEVLRLLTSYITIAINNIHKSQILLQTNIRLENASNRDGLTGLLNRRALKDYIANDFSSIIKASLPVTMVMLDLDYFKQYNDFYGHSKGDECLIAVSKVIKETMNALVSQHYAFRFGGDEFLLILESCNEAFCKKILNTLFKNVVDLEIEHLKSKVSNQVTLTAGASIIKRSLLDYTEVFSNADEALYVAKNDGRNRYEILILN